jgi:hypothetical protein
MRWMGRVKEEKNMAAWWGWIGKEKSKKERIKSILLSSSLDKVWIVL